MERSLLRELRLRRGWTQRQLAALAAITQPHLCHLERGHVRYPTMPVVRRLAEALDVEVIAMLQFMEIV